MKDLKTWSQLVYDKDGLVTYDAIQLLKLSDIAGALSLEVHNGITSPFDEDLHTIRPQSGQLATARNIRNLLENSGNTTEATQDRVQDPYTLRCIPQIHGASKDSIAYVLSKIEIEINSVTDNPIITKDGNVQQHLGISGTTAKEAATTIEGSIGSMKAAWQNWLAGLGNPDADMGALSTQLADSIGTALGNIVPRVGAIAKGVVSAIPRLFSGLVQQLPAPFQTAVAAIGDAFRDVKSFFAPIQGAVAPLIAAFAALGASGISPLLSKIPLLGGVLGGLTSPLTMLGGPIGLLVTALGTLIATTPKLSAAFGEMASGVLTSLMGAFTSLLPSIQSLMTALQSIASAVLPVIISAIGQIIPLIQPIIDMLVGVLTPIIQQVIETVTNAVNTVLPIIQMLAPAVSAVISDIVGLIQQLLPVIQSILSVVGSVISAVLGFINGMLLPAVQAMLPSISGVISGIGAVIQGIVTVVSGVIRMVTAVIRGDWQGAWDAFKSILSGAVGAAGGALKGVISAITGVFAGAGTLLLSAGKAIVQGLIDGISSMIHAAGNAIKGVMNTISSFIPHSPAKRGPFSGRGWTPYSGRALVQGLADGMDAAQDDAVAAIGRVMRSVRDELDGDGLQVPVTAAGTVQLRRALASVEATASKRDATNARLATAAAASGPVTTNVTVVIDGKALRADPVSAQHLMAALQGFGVGLKANRP